MRLLLLLLLIVPLHACGGSGLAVVRVHLGSASVRAEVAQEPAARQRGLMYRKSMGTNAGMLFVFDDDRPRSFWMKNTFIPLSIAYIDKAGVIVRIADMTPHEERSVRSGEAARYALEVNQGWFAEHGVKEGSAVRFKLPDGTKVGK